MPPINYLTIARKKPCMVITYNANMTPAARRRDFDTGGTPVDKVGE